MNGLLIKTTTKFQKDLTFIDLSEMSVTRYHSKVFVPFFSYRKEIQRIQNLL